MRIHFLTFVLAVCVQNFGRQRFRLIYFNGKYRYHVKSDCRKVTSVPGNLRASTNMPGQPYNLKTFARPVDRCCSRATVTFHKRGCISVPSNGFRKNALVQPLQLGSGYKQGSCVRLRTDYGIESVLSKSMSKLGTVQYAATVGTADGYRR